MQKYLQQVCPALADASPVCPNLFRRLVATASLNQRGLHLIANSFRLFIIRFQSGTPLVRQLLEHRPAFLGQDRRPDVEPVCPGICLIQILNHVHKTVGVILVVGNSPRQVRRHKILHTRQIEHIPCRHSQGSHFGSIGIPLLVIKGEGHPFERSRRHDQIVIHAPVKHASLRGSQGHRRSLGRHDGTVLRVNRQDTGKPGSPGHGNLCHFPAATAQIKPQKPAQQAETQHTAVRCHAGSHVQLIVIASCHSPLFRRQLRHQAQCPAAVVQARLFLVGVQTVIHVRFRSRSVERRRRTARSRHEQPVCRIRQHTQRVRLAPGHFLGSRPHLRRQHHRVLRGHHRHFGRVARAVAARIFLSLVSAGNHAGSQQQHHSD